MPSVSKPVPTPAGDTTLPVSYLGKIHQGDCVAQMQALPAGCIHMAFADPPFNIGYEYDQYDDRLDHQRYLDWCRSWIGEVHRILRSDGTFWLAIGDEYAAELKLLSQEVGFVCRSWVSWYYTFGVHCKRKFTRSHAHLFHFVKDAAHYTFNVEDIRVPSARQLVYNDARAASGGRMPDDTFILRPQDCVDGLLPDEDTWYFPRVAGTFKERAGFHGCQMPEQLLGRILRASSNAGDVLFDPFSGSATTLAVAKKLGRQFFGFELSSDYVKYGTERLAASCVGDALDGAAEPKASAPRTFEKNRRAKGDTAALSGLPATTRLPAAMLDQTETLIDAFADVCRGFSVDRVVVDPILNEDLQMECDRRSIAGTPAERNRLLMRLRKAALLKRAGIVTSTPTRLHWNDLNPFIFASEIAWRRILDLYAATLDEIFCDPRVARQFDDIAAKFAPGFTPLEYRWAALKLRKEGAKAKQRAERLKADLGLPEFNQPVSVGEVDWTQLPQGPGVYAIANGVKQPKYLYAGETTCLRTRLQSHFKTDEQRTLWQHEQGDVQVIFRSVPAIDDYRLARQSALIARLKPLWNLTELLAI